MTGMPSSSSVFVALVALSLLLLRYDDVLPTATSGKKSLYVSASSSSSYSTSVASAVARGKSSAARAASASRIRGVKTAGDLRGQVIAIQQQQLRRADNLPLVSDLRGGASGGGGSGGKKKRKRKRRKIKPVDDRTENEGDDDEEEVEEEQPATTTRAETATSSSSSSSSSSGTTTKTGSPGANSGASGGGGEKTIDEVRRYRLQQQLYLQSRSLQLRQALIDRGFDALRHSAETGGDGDASRKVPVDWECAVSTADDPKSCLYTMDAQEGAKLIAPMLEDDQRAEEDDDDEDDDYHDGGEDIDRGDGDENNKGGKKKRRRPRASPDHKWITLTTLNRLRRKDPTKVDPLWHDKYDVLRTWFSRGGGGSPYSLYPHLSPAAATLSFLLDHDVVLVLSIVSAAFVAIVLTLPVWERLACVVLTSPGVWTSWTSWARFLHAALPFKIVTTQIAFKMAASSLTKLYVAARLYLIELECQYFEQCVPLTIVEDNDDDDDDDDDEQE